MSFLKSVFANASTTAELSTDNESLAKTNKRLEKQVENLSEELKQTRRVHGEEMYLQERKYERKTNDLSYTIETERKRHKQEEDTLNKRVEEAEMNADETIATRVAEQTAVARLEIEEQYVNELNEVQSLAITEVARADAAEARAEEKDEVIKELKSQLKDYREFVQFAMEKLPTVDMSKFNVNVDMPSPEVTVVSQGGGKKN